MLSMCGSVESSDCLITLYQNEGIEIEIKSIVLAQYGSQIRKVVMDTLGLYGLNNLRVDVNDLGAFDFTIKARLIAALKRADLI